MLLYFTPFSLFSLSMLSWMILVNNVLPVRALPAMTKANSHLLISKLLKRGGTLGTKRSPYNTNFWRESRSHSSTSKFRTDENLGFSLVHMKFLI